MECLSEDQKCSRCPEKRDCGCFRYCRNHKAIFAPYVCQCELKLCEIKKQYDKIEVNITEDKIEEVEDKLSQSYIDLKTMQNEITVKSQALNHMDTLHKETTQLYQQQIDDLQTLYYNEKERSQREEKRNTLNQQQIEELLKRLDELKIETKPQPEPEKRTFSNLIESDIKKKKVKPSNKSLKTHGSRQNNLL